MAQFFRDFSQYTLAEAPSDWTKRWVFTAETEIETGGDFGTNLLRYKAVSGVRQAFTLNAMDDAAGRDDVEVLTRVKSSGFGTSSWLLLLGGSGDADAETGLGLTYNVNSSPSRLQLNIYNAGALSNPSTHHYPTTLSSNVWYWVRIRVTGDAVWYKLWAGDYEEEPGWLVANAVMTAGAMAVGYAGVGVGSSTATHRYDYYAVGTGGDAAPGPSAGPSAAVLSDPTATSITTTTATIGATTDSATGTLYAVVTASATPPSVAQIKAGENDGGTAAVWAGSDAALELGANTFAVTGLTADTAYHTYFVQDAGVDDSNILAGSFSTLSAADETPPTLSAAAIATTGQTITLTFDEEVAIGAGGSAGWTLSASGGASAMTYASGEGSTALVYNLARRIESGETATIAYTQPGDGIEDASGNDLATLSGAAVTNSSTYEPDVTAPTLSTATVPTGGGAITLAFSEVVVVGAGGNAGWTLTASGGASAMSYVSGSGSSSLVYNLDRTILTGETLTVAYVQPGNGIEDASGNDLATLSGASVTNNSTQTAEPPPATGDYAVPASTTPAGFKTWAELIASRAQLLDGIPEGTKIVLATDDQAIADAYPEFVWIVLE